MGVRPLIRAAAAGADTVQAPARRGVWICLQLWDQSHGLVRLSKLDYRTVAHNDRLQVLFCSTHDPLIR